MKDFATYILEEKDIYQKMLITYYLSKKTGIYFDKAIVLKTELVKLFIEYMKINIDENLVTTAMLLCNCKKTENAQKIGKLERYAKEGAEYLSTLGFSEHFCRICEQVNRYSESTPREREGDILEIVDQFVGLILNRVEREAFTTVEALVILKERNFKYTDNKYMNQFVRFVEDFEKITIKETINIPIIKKLIHLHNKEANTKTYIAALTNVYSDKIDEALKKNAKKKAKKKFAVETEKQETKVVDTLERMKELTEEKKKSTRSLFTDDTAKKVLSHEANYKLDD